MYFIFNLSYVYGKPVICPLFFHRNMEKTSMLQCYVIIFIYSSADASIPCSFESYFNINVGDRNDLNTYFPIIVHIFLICIMPLILPRHMEYIEILLLLWYDCKYIFQHHFSTSFSQCFHIFQQFLLLQYFLHFCLIYMVVLTFYCLSFIGDLCRRSNKI